MAPILQKGSWCLERCGKSPKSQDWDEGWGRHLAHHSDSFVWVIYRENTPRHTENRATQR
jgi:hypothetical protein